jgi:hypothetical protein
MRHAEINHLHKRKRIHQLHQPYPHPDPKIKFLDDVVMAGAVIMPLLAVPQVYHIWASQNAQGISLLTWLS